MFKCDLDMVMFFKKMGFLKINMLRKKTNKHAYHFIAKLFKLFEFVVLA